MSSVFSCAVLNQLNVLFVFVNICLFLILSDSLFFWFLQPFYCVVVQFYFKPTCILFCFVLFFFQTSLAHIHDHEGNLTWMFKIAFVVFHYNLEIAVLLFKNVSSRPSHLSNGGNSIYKVCIFNSNSCFRALSLSHEQ